MLSRSCCCFIFLKHRLRLFYSFLFFFFKETINWTPNTQIHRKADSYIPLRYNICICICIWSKRYWLRMNSRVRMSVVMCVRKQCVYAWHEKTDNNIKEIHELKLMTIIFLAFWLKKRSTCEWRRHSFLQLLLLLFFFLHTHTHNYFFPLHQKLYLYWQPHGKFYTSFFRHV